MALLEIAIDRAADGRAALDAGADRLEVCASLDAGGCTPSMEMFRSLRVYTDAPLFVMLRPRAGSFVYSAAERRAMMDDATAFQDNGADGFVFGGLTSSGAIDTVLLKDLLRTAGERPCTFHRAFDEIADPIGGLQLLITAGVARVLTSGGSPTAAEGIPQLQSYVAHSLGKVLIIPGGGVRPSNIEQIIHDTGVREIHSSGRDEQGVLDPQIVSLLAGIAHSSSG